ncbi:MAG: RDD family protein [Kangiellaceae bacterium]|nr:RDD family protein [Kangiellaceae bacterium]MCW8997570.1 RDD family protein [Kangiellaceae bacterium]MCW9016745.1 RDD family protein [Kangiellaceae bacterium]
MLDTTRAVEVPEGITLSLPVAGYVSRALAFLVDLIIRFVIFIGLSWIFSIFDRLGDGLLLLSVFLVEWFYPVFFEVFWLGQTPGKKVMGILVVNDDGTPINWSSSIIRNLLRFADFLPAFWAFGLISMMLNRDFKRLGDLAAGTLVIHQREVISPQSNHDAEGLAPKTPLKLDEQSAIIAYSDRIERMTQARADELARYLTPWLQNSQGNQSSALQIVRMARWLKGRREKE